MGKKNKLFIDLDSLFSKEEIDGTGVDVYMLHRFLSMNPASFNVSQISNVLSNKLPKWASVRLLQILLPKRNQAPRVRYIKRGAIKKKLIVEKIAIYLHCSIKHAEQSYEVYKSIDVDIESAFGVKI